MDRFGVICVGQIFFQLFPENVLLKIMTYLSITDQQSLSVTCKRLSELCNLVLFKKIELRDRIIRSGALARMTEHYKLVHLNLRESKICKDVTVDCTIQKLSNLPNLTKLHLGYSKMCSKCLNSLLETTNQLKWANLDGLYVRNRSMRSLARNNQLNKLSLQNCLMFTAGLSKAMEKLKSLRHLRVSNVFFHGPLLESLQQATKHLETLDISDSPFINHDIDDICLHFSNLRSLNLSNCKLLSAGCLLRLNALKNLKGLVLYGTHINVTTAYRYFFPMRSLIAIGCNPLPVGMDPVRSLLRINGESIELLFNRDTNPELYNAHLLFEFNTPET